MSSDSIFSRSSSIQSVKLVETSGVISTGDDDADVLADAGRVNDVLSRLIRERPDAWAWMIKRWKDRPTAELGPYPAYSRWNR